MDNLGHGVRHRAVPREYSPGVYAPGEFDVYPIRVCLTGPGSVDGRPADPHTTGAEGVDRGTPCV